ncbi:MATE family efflux protein [Streptococcus varani]|uniref:Probable multidrug resistance protein NorM n=1 Tax=Streptococcus varani TaxID=1608583 RepID=A0A0E4CSM8_9STRE|nr:MATE family efflux transporter [Streptococcus varani]CQR24734.1 MATE family efflux protein [Streptococcus varani]
MQDLTQGKPIKVILQFTLPLLIGSFFQLAYNFADAMIVGQTLGQLAFASVGATGSIVFLILGFAQGLTTGLSIIISQRFGAGDSEGIERSFVHGLFYSILVSFVLSFLSLVGLRPLLEIMQMPQELIDGSQGFLTAIFGGMVFTVLYNYFSSAIRALGDSKTPLYALIVASIINVLLDFFFILNLKMGVFGAGLATILAQAFSVLYLVIYSQKKISYFKVHKGIFQLKKEELLVHAKIGFPMAFQASIIAIGAITLQVVLNQLGTDAIAAQSIASKTDQLAMLPMVNLGLAISTFTAQNYGAKKFHRLLEGLKQTLLVTVVWAIFFAIILIVFNTQFSGLFLANPSKNVLDLAFIYYIINGLCYWILSILFVTRSFIQGLGNGFVPTLAGFAELVMRAGVAILGAQFFGYAGVAAASPAAWIGSVAILIPSLFVFIRGMKKEGLIL